MLDLYFDHYGLNQNAPEVMKPLTSMTYGSSLTSDI